MPTSSLFSKQIPLLDDGVACNRGTLLTAPRTIDLAGLPEPVIRSIQQLVESLREETKPAETRPPSIGRFAHLGYSIPKEVIDEAQRECWANFPRDFPDVEADKK